MTAADIEYPGQNFVLNAVTGSLEFSSSVDMELSLRLLEVVNGVAARYREKSEVSLLVVHCTCFKLAMDYCFVEFFINYQFFYVL
jgi:hypothetical protein